MHSPTQLQTPSTETEPYEWGVIYRNHKGELQIAWGYALDPRTTGAIDELGSIAIDGVFHLVLIIGKRLQGTPPIWETPSGIALTPSD